MYLFLILLTQIFTQETQSIRKCTGASEDDTYERGGKMTLCVHFLEENKRMAFTVDIDKYSAVQMKGAFSQINQKRVNIDIVAQAETDKVESSPIRYLTLEAGNTIIFNIFTLVVRLKQGKIAQLIWDNGCYGGSTKCSEYKTIYNETERNNYISICDNSNSGPCDPKIFVAFIGTDAQNNYCTSAQLRISRFKQYALGEFYEGSKNVFDE